MPTITIDLDLPDNANIPLDWDARAFVLAKMQEEGFLASDQATQTAGESDEEDDDPDSWFTPEIRKKAKENRRRWEEEARRNPPKRSKEELLELLLNLPVADEETIKRQDEAREHMRQWKLPW
jgi:hypothetical protein